MGGTRWGKKDSVQGNKQATVATLRKPRTVQESGPWGFIATGIHCVICRASYWYLLRTTTCML